MKYFGLPLTAIFSYRRNFTKLWYQIEKVLETFSNFEIICLESTAVLTVFSPFNSVHLSIVSHLGSVRVVNNGWRCFIKILALPFAQRSYKVPLKSQYSKDVMLYFSCHFTDIDAIKINNISKSTKGF